MDIVGKENNINNNINTITVNSQIVENTNKQFLKL